MAHKCSECDYATDRVYNLKRHLGRHHSSPISEPASTHSCSKCGQYFSRKCKAAAHESKCNGILPLQCPTCLVEFSNKYIKYRHIRKASCTPPQTIDWIDFTTPNADPIQLRIDHVDDPNILRPLFDSEFNDMLSRFADLIFAAPENRIVQKVNLSRRQCKVYIAHDNAWKDFLDDQVFYKLTRSLCSALLLLAKKHKRIYMSRDYKEKLREVCIDCEAEASDENVYSRDTLKAIRTTIYSIRTLCRKPSMSRMSSTATSSRRPGRE
jgi:hypothetical protein